MRDLTIIITCLREAEWVEGCVRSLLPALDELEAEIVIADIEPEGSALDRVLALDERLRTVRCMNRGFAHANNEAALTAGSRYVLFLNPDTQLVEGSLARLVAELDRRPEIGLTGVRQLTPQGHVYPTMRRRLSPLRMLGEALGSERLAPGVSWLGHRRLDLESYQREQPCDWTTGSFMLVRREALLSAGLMDERYFFGVEEEDLCLRIREAGWQVIHTPAVTIVHHVGKSAPSERLERQAAYAKLQYARKNLPAMRRGAFVGALLLFLAVRAVAAPDRARRGHYRGAIRVVLGLDRPPFGEPPPTALPVDAALAVD